MAVLHATPPQVFLYEPEAGTFVNGTAEACRLSDREKGGFGAVEAKRVIGKANFKSQNSKGKGGDTLFGCTFNPGAMAL